MAGKARKTAKSKTAESKKRSAKRSSLLRMVQDHPVRTAGIAAGAAVGLVLASKVAKTAAKVMTVKAVGKTAKDVVRAGRTTRKPAGRRKARKTGGARKAKSARPAGRKATPAKP